MELLSYEPVGAMVIWRWVTANDSHPSRFLFHFNDPAGCYRSLFLHKGIGFNLNFPRQRGKKTSLDSIAPFSFLSTFPTTMQTRKKLTNWPKPSQYHLSWTCRLTVYIISNSSKHHHYHCIWNTFSPKYQANIKILKMPRMPPQASIPVLILLLNSPEPSKKCCYCNIYV